MFETHCLNIYIYIYALDSVSGQTTGPNWLKFFKERRALKLIQTTVNVVVETTLCFLVDNISSLK